MKKLFLILQVLILSTISLDVSSYSYLYFNAKKEKIGDESFRRYVYPNVRQIISIYYSIIRKMDPVQESLVDLKQLILKMNIGWQQTLKNCKSSPDTPHFTQIAGSIPHRKTSSIKSCNEELQVHGQQIQALEKKILSIKTEKFEKYTQHPFASIDRFIRLSDTLDDMYFLTIQSANAFKFLRLENKKDASIDHIRNNLDQLLVMADLTSLDQMDDLYREEFTRTWQFFIKKLERFVLYNNEDFFLAQLEELNIYWNSLHMKIDRGSIQIPGMKSLVEIHMHWNGILRLYLNK